MESTIATEPVAETVMQDHEGRWVRKQFDTRTEFVRIDSNGYQAAQIAFVDPDAQLLKIDGMVMIESDGYLYSMMLQRVLASSRLEFENGDVVYFGGFRRREYLQYDESGSGMLRVVGRPPWVTPHDLKFDIVGNLALTHIVTPAMTLANGSPTYLVQAFLFSVERGFFQLFDMQARECQPGSAELGRENGKYYVRFNGKRLEVD